MSLLQRLVTSSWHTAASTLRATTSATAGVTASNSNHPGWYGSSSSGWNAPSSTSVRSFASKKHKALLKHSKGFRGRSKNCYSIAVRRVEKGWQYAYRDRKRKRREYKKVWIQRISAGVRQYAWSYSNFMRHLYGGGGGSRALDTHNRTGNSLDSGIRLNRKVLAELAAQEPFAFKAVVDVVQEATGVYKEPATYTPEDGWDFDDSAGAGEVVDDYYYDPDTSEWLPKEQQQQ